MCVGWVGEHIFVYRVIEELLNILNQCVPLFFIYVGARVCYALFHPVGVKYKISNKCYQN